MGMPISKAGDMSLGHAFSPSPITPTITKVYSYSVEAIDSSHLDYKFMSDMDKI